MAAELLRGAPAKGSVGASRGTHTTPVKEGPPRFLLKGSLEGDTDIGIDMDVDIHIDLDDRGT